MHTPMDHMINKFSIPELLDSPKRGLEDLLGFETPKDHPIDKKNHPELEFEPERKHHHVSKQDPDPVTPLDHQIVKEDMFDLLDSPSKPPIKQSHIKQEIPHTPLDHHTDPLHDPFLQKSPHKPHEYAHAHPV